MGRIMEYYTKNARFILICNHINKILPSLQSRCAKFRFSQLDSKSIKNYLKFISKQENLKLQEKTIETILKLSEGDLRKCLNILQATYLAYPKITSYTLYQCTGYPKPNKIENIWNL